MKWGWTETETTAAGTTSGGFIEYHMDPGVVWNYNLPYGARKKGSQDYLRIDGMHVTVTVFSDKTIEIDLLDSEMNRVDPFDLPEDTFAKIKQEIQLIKMR